MAGHRGARDHGRFGSHRARDRHRGRTSLAALAHPGRGGCAGGAHRAHRVHRRPATRLRAAQLAVPDASGPLLRIEGLSVEDELTDVSFDAAGGEIVGLAGLEGSGVATLLGVLFGTQHATAGSVTLPDGAHAPASPTHAARRGVALVPADRRNQGLMLDRSVERNVSLVAIGTLPRREWLRPAELTAAARRQIERLRIQASGPSVPVGSLSGGNQQKVVVGRWLEVAPRVMLLDDPTRGVDVGAKREIYLLIRALADDGRIVLFRSTELPELVGLADRILVFHRGRLACTLAGGEATDHDVLHAINTGRAPDLADPPIAGEGVA
jgi:ribose transport system ATP-binding protein